MPPAFPPGDPARTPDEPSDLSPGVPASSARARGRVELLRTTVGPLSDELAGLQQAMATAGRHRPGQGRRSGPSRVQQRRGVRPARGPVAEREPQAQTVAPDVLAALDSGADRAEAVLSALQLPDHGRNRPPATRATPVAVAAGAGTRWPPRVSDREQLLALADLGEHLAAPAGPGRRAPRPAARRCGGPRRVRRDVRDGPGRRGNPRGRRGLARRRRARRRPAGCRPPGHRGAADGASAAVPPGPGPALPGPPPTGAAARHGRDPGRARHPRPAVWSLLFDHGVPSDRSSRAMLDRAGGWRPER